MSATPHVFVGLSGGVDSAVAARRLQRAGCSVTGVFIKVWHPDWLACDWEAERLDAMRVAAHLEIPFLTCDAEVAYRDAVAADFITEYAAGRTPNPDILCNEYVKFGAFRDFARAHGADAIATGHYAQRRARAGGGYTLHRGVDADKDQSYFLYRLRPEDLAYTRFPVGDTPKAKIRAEATAAGIPTAHKRDSQGICFLGHVDICDFLSHYLTLTPGPVVTTDGTVIGSHRGAACYTLGQRHGLTITKRSATRQPHYVVATDVPTNTVVVATEPAALERSATVLLRDCVFKTALSPNQPVSVQTRYRQQPVPARVVTTTDDTCQLVLDQALVAPAPGQSCVCYADTECLGGGIIAEHGSDDHKS